MTDTTKATVPISAEMHSLAESWEESAKQGGDPDAVHIAEAAQKGDPDAIAQILDFERQDGDPKVALEAERAQEEIEASVITLTEREEEAHGLRATKTQCGRMLIHSEPQEFLVDLDDWQEWVEHGNPWTRSHFGGLRFWDSWAQRGDEAKWDANNEVWRVS